MPRARGSRAPSFLCLVYTLVHAYAVRPAFFVGAAPYVHTATSTAGHHRRTAAKIPGASSSPRRAISISASSAVFVAFACISELTSQRLQTHLQRIPRALRHSSLMRDPLPPRPPPQACLPPRRRHRPILSPVPRNAAVGASSSPRVSPSLSQGHATRARKYVLLRHLPSSCSLR